MHQGQMQSHHQEGDLSEPAPLVASASSTLSPPPPPPPPTVAVADDSSTLRESSTVEATMKITDPQQVMILTEDNLIESGKLRQTEDETNQVDEKLQTASSQNEDNEHNDQPSAGEVQELPKCEQDDIKNEPGELDEQSGISHAADAEPERELIHKPNVKPRESPDDSEDGDGESCQSATCTETLSRQVADAEALVAQQIDSIISMTTLKTITPLPVESRSLISDENSLSSSMSLSLSLDTDSNSVIKVQVTNDHVIDDKGKFGDDLDIENELVVHNSGSESASGQNLRLLKMSASEDVLVCEQNRGSVEAARSMFQTLGRKQQQQQQQHKPKQQPVAHKKKQLESQTKYSAGPVQRSSSLSSSHESPVESVDDNHELGAENNNNNNTNNNNNNNNENPSTKRDHRQSTLDNQVYDVKIVRRSGSSLSTSGYRRTLVCSMSPTSQMGSGSDMSLQDASVIYPIEGDEIIQCKNAFRENKRLIEQQQENGRPCGGFASTLSSLNRAPLCHQSESISTWTLRNKSNITLPDCTHCNQKLYPVDKMELDFTKFTLNIHRNCFRCRVCSSMLRLETYSAIDAKLYCPAHVKCIMTTR